MCLSSSHNLACLNERFKLILNRNTSEASIFLCGTNNYKDETVVMSKREILYCNISSTKIVYQPEINLIYQTQLDTKRNWMTTLFHRAQAIIKNNQIKTAEER